MKFKVEQRDKDSLENIDINKMLLRHSDRIEAFKHGRPSIEIAQVLVTFENGYDLSIARGKGTYGADDGLYEIMPSDPSCFDDEDKGKSIEVLGWLTMEMVKYYFDKIVNMDTKSE